MREWDAINTASEFHLPIVACFAGNMLDNHEYLCYISFNVITSMPNSFSCINSTFIDLVCSLKFQSITSHRTIVIFISNKLQV